jgi:hypothetical protein
MATTLRFREHEEFHRAALHMGLAGAGAGLVAHLTGILYPRVGGLLAPIPLAILVGAAAFGAASPETRVRLKEIGVVLLGMAAAALGLRFLGRLGPEPTLGAAVFALAFGALVARGVKGRKFFFTLMGASLAALTARFVFQTFLAQTASPGSWDLPDWLGAVIAGGAFGLVGLLGTLPRHLELHQDRIQDKWKAIKDKSHGEIGELLGRAATLWEKVDASLERDSSARRAIEDSVMRVFDVAQKWQSVETESSLPPADKLVERMEEIDQKIARTDDSVAKSQYERARGALAEQLRYVQEINTSKERVVARMHHYLAAMERLRFAVINHRSADASRLSTEVQPILDDLNLLGKEIDCTSEALGEVEKEAEQQNGASAPN